MVTIKRKTKRNTFFFLKFEMTHGLVKLIFTKNYMKTPKINVYEIAESLQAVALVGLGRRMCSVFVKLR